MTTYLVLFCSPLFAFDFDDVVEIERAEQMELLELSKEAAREWRFSKAREYLDEAKNKAYDPVAIKETQKVLDSAIAAKKADDERRERLAREERERQARAERERQASASSGGGSRAEDMKNWCLGISKYQSNCYLIKDADIKNACLGMTAYSSNCYSISDSAMKNACLGISGDSSSGYYKLLCAGARLGSSNCYSIR